MDPTTVNASVFALIFVGLLLTVLGLFAAGNLAVVGLGLAALIAAGVLEAVPARRR